MATGRMAAATARTVVGEGAAPTTAAPGSVAPVTPQAGTAPSTAAPGTTAPTAPVRPTTTVHLGKAAVASLEEADLVPVDEVVTRARAPFIEFGLCLLLLVASV